MRADDPGPGGSVLSDGLGQDPERAEFELFVAEWTGVDMRHHESSGTWGLGLDSFAWACWKRSKAAERERCARVADEHTKRTFPWGSENAEIYHAQADWAAAIATSIRQLKA